MKFLFQVLAAVAIVARGAEAVAGVEIDNTVFGGSGGDQYSDEGLVAPTQTVQAVHLCTGDRVNGIGIDFTTRDGQSYNVFHGGRGGDLKSLTLKDGEHVTGLDLHLGEKGGSRRIVYAKFITDQDNTISGGTPVTDREYIWYYTAPKGYQLGGFRGTAGSELDSCGVIWTSIDTPVTDPPTYEDF